MKSVTFLIIPGLNDLKPLTKWFYGWTERRWSRQGRQAVVCFVNWGDDQSYQEKLRIVEEKAAMAQRQGRQVILVGVSAGATLAVLSFARQRVRTAGVVTICGLLQLAPGDDQKVAFFSKSWFRAAQACQQMIGRLSDPQKKRIICAVPLRDSIVNPSRAQVSGAAVIRMKSIGHLTSIFVALVFYRRKIWHLLQLALSRD